MKLELRDNRRQLSEPITATVIAIISAGTAIANAWEKYGLDDYDWNNVFDPSAAERKRFDKLWSFYVKNNGLKDPRTGKGLADITGMSCAELNKYYQFLESMRQYWSDSKNFKAGTKMRVVRRYELVAITAMATVYQLGMKKGCVKGQQGKPGKSGQPELPGSSTENTLKKALPLIALAALTQV